MDDIAQAPLFPGGSSDGVVPVFPPKGFFGSFGRVGRSGQLAKFGDGIHFGVGVVDSKDSDWAFAEGFHVPIEGFGDFDPEFFEVRGHDVERWFFDNLLVGDEKASGFDILENFFFLWSLGNVGFEQSESKFHTGTGSEGCGQLVLIQCEWEYFGFSILPSGSGRMVSLPQLFRDCPGVRLRISSILAVKGAGMGMVFPSSTRVFSSRCSWLQPFLLRISFSSFWASLICLQMVTSCSYSLISVMRLDRTPEVGKFSPLGPRIWILDSWVNQIFHGR